MWRRMTLSPGLGVLAKAASQLQDPKRPPVSYSRPGWTVGPSAHNKSGPQLAPFATIRVLPRLPQVRSYVSAVTVAPSWSGRVLSLSPRVRVDVGSLQEIV